MKKAILLLFSFFSFTVSFSQLPCSDTMHRQFDFWLGEWEVYGMNDQKAGDSRISLLLDSCIILEEWSSRSMVRGVRYAGKSYNSYSAARKRWQQYWVDNVGGATAYFNGHYENKKMTLETDNTKQLDGSFKIQRMTFHHLSSDKVRQHGESSTDGGKTWKTDFDLEYRRKK